jgi:integrase
MRGDGRLYRRPRSPFYWCEYWLRGKPHRESTGTADEKTAQKFLRRRLKEVGADQIGAKTFISPKQERVTVNALLDSLEADYKLRGKWSRKTASLMKAVRERFGDWRAIDVDADAVTSYLRELQEQDYKPSSINRRTQLLGQAFKLAMRTRKLNAGPFIPHLSETGNERQGFFETEYFNSIVVHLPEHLQDFARFGFLVGWRKSTLRNLRWSDVGDDVIHLPSLRVKNRKPDSIPLVGELENIIDRRRAAAVHNGRFSEFVFHHEGSQIVDDFRGPWERALLKAGLPEGLTFHDFRRTAARNLVRSGVPQSVAMKITGHRSDSMFRRYAIVDESQKRDALAQVQVYLKQNVKKVFSIREAAK